MPRQIAAARRTAAGREGLKLMSQAVAACRTTGFSGVEISHWWGPAGVRVGLADVWHRPGAQTVAQPLGGPTASSAESRIVGDALPGPSVSLMISAKQLDLLEAGYVLSYLGSGTVDGRAAEVVAVDRANGSMAAKYWLDQQTRLPLRRQLFDSRGRVVSDITFSDLRVGPQAVDSMPVAGAQPWTRQLTAAKVAGLRTHGWPLPGELPGGMVLFAASQTATTAGTVIGVSYSDGLSVISLFVQRGELPAVLAGWQRVAIAGQHAYAVDPDDQTIAWSGDGYVFTMISDAPASTVDQAVAALPHAGSPDLWARLSRGFRRLASWANPFR